MVTLWCRGPGAQLLNLASVSRILNQERGNAWRACLGKICRQQYLRHYPVKLIRPDGSSIEIRYLEPRSVVQLPVDVNALSEDEKRQRLAARKPKAKKIVQEKIDDNFDPSEYMKFWDRNIQESREPTREEPKESKPKKVRKAK